jgi:arylsulfatase A-like enzyme
MATSFIEKNSEKPWIMYVNFLDPHTPFTSVFDNMYDPEKMQVPASFNQPTDPKELAPTRAVRAAIEKGIKDYKGIMNNDDAVRRSKAHYWGKISLVDKMIGRILTKLEERGQAEDTIVVFTTDHGEMMGDHHLMFKSVMYEESAKIPMLLKIPGMTVEQDVKQPVSHIDVVPTLLDLLGEEIPTHLQGNSWARSLKRRENPPERNVIVEWNGAPWPFDNMPTEPLRTLRTNDGWKMTLAPQSEGEMYNLNLDPGEMHNVFYEIDSLEKIKQFVAEINLWQRATGDAPLLFDQAAWQKRREEFTKAGIK